MRALVAWLAVAALAGHVTADRFRTVLVGGKDWSATGGDQGCDVCSGGSHDGRGHQSGGYQSSSSHSSRYSSSGELAPRHSSAWESSGAGLLGRSGGGRRTYHYTSEESEYTFSNGTHSTTITSKRSSEGVPEFHLQMTRLGDGAVIESTVLSETEYRQRRASLGLTGSDGSFGFESLGGVGGDIHGLSGRRLSGKDLLADLERRMGRRRGGHSRHSTTSFSSEESHYSFSNGTHTTSITGRRNSEGVREYGLELIRDSDGAVLDRATISEAEYERRRQSMTSGEGFDNVFDIHGIRGSRTQSSEYDSRYGSRSRSRSDDRSDSRSGSRFDSRYDSRYDSRSGSRSDKRSDSRSRSRSEFESTSEESDFGQHSSDRRPLPSGSSGSSGSRSTYIREERTETRREESSEVCSCMARSRCEPTDRVISRESLLRCRSGEVCCRNPREDLHPLRPRRPAEDPGRSRPRQPAAEPQVSGPSCSCVPRSSCNSPRRDYSLAGLEKCRSPMVCCRPHSPASADDRPPLLTTLPPSRRTTPDPALVQRERELFRDIVQHVDTEEAPVQRPLSTNALQNSLSRYDDAHDVSSGGQRRTEITRSRHSRTESYGGHGGRPRYDEPQQTSSSSQRRYSYGSRGRSSTSSEHGDFDTRYPVGTSDGQTHGSRSQLGTDRGRYDASQSRHRQTVSAEDSSEQGDTRVVSSRRHYSERRVISSQDSDEDERPILWSSRHDSSSGRAGQHTAQQPVDLPGPEVSSSSSRSHSYERTSSSSSSSDLGEAGRLLGTGGAGQRRLDTSLHGRTDQYGEPVVTSSSRRHSVQRTISGGGGGDLLADAGGDLGLSGGSSGDTGVISSSRRYSERRVVSGDAGAADLGLGAGHDGAHSSGSRYSSSSSWSSRSESGSSGEHVPGGSYQYRSGPSGSSGSSYRYSSSSRSSQTAPVESSSSYWSRYSQQSQRQKRGWPSWLGGDEEEPTTYQNPSDRDSCVCVYFDRCSDGNLLHHGADLLDFSIGTRKQCGGFRVCCDVRPDLVRQLQATPNLRPGVVSSVPANSLQQSSGLAPHVSQGQPCICVASYLCQDGRIGASQQQLIDMRQVSQTGRCNYDGQVCCAVTWAQVKPTSTPAPPPCVCVAGSQCRQQDILTRYTNANAPTCPGTQVCCSRPQTGSGIYPSPTPGYEDQQYNMYLFCKSYPLSVACSDTQRFSVLPTIRPTPYFNAENDVRALRGALRLFRVDDDVLIGILTRRTFQERDLIKRTFYTQTGSKLADMIERYTTGSYENLLVELLEGASMEEYLAKKLHEGMDGVGTDEDAVLETLISSTNDEIAKIKYYFYKESGHTLEDDIEDDFSGDLEDILVALANGTRDNSLTVDPRRAREQALALRQAGEDRLGTDENTFKYYLTHENYAQLALIFSQYDQLSDKSFSETLKKEFTQHTEEAVLAIVEVTQNLPAYFAGRLHDALWGRGILSKDDSSLRRILISRAERDLGTIAQEYYSRYGETLRHDIELKSTSDYEDALVSLLGETP